MGTRQRRGWSQGLLRLAAGIAVWAAALCCAASASAADLNGHWRTADGVFSVVEQTGNAIQVTNTSNSRVYVGTIDASSVELTSTDPLNPESYSLTLSPDETALAGVFHTIGCVFSYCIPVTDNVTLSRCGCWDGNTDSGDGCDVECHAEPCYSCTAEPSTCSPVADSTPCEDPSDCVSGGTCSAGTCDGGLQASACVDIGGKWQRTAFYYEPGYQWTLLDQVVQSGGSLSFYTSPGGYREAVGTLDTSTGALETSGGSDWPYCGITGLGGRVASDGDSYTGVRWYEASTPHGCVALDVIGEIGLRCAPGSIPTADGCAVDSCQQCSGDPVVCVPVPDQTACHSDDPCTVVAACQRGECVALVSDVCPVCTTCNGSGGCVSAPRNNCRKTDDPASTMLSIKSTQAGVSGAYRWDWSGGGAIRPYDLGRPDLYSDVALCVFDESTALPATLMQASVDYEYSGYSFVDGWSIDETGSATYRDRKGYFYGIKSIDLTAGPAGQSRIRVKGKRGGLPLAPFALPLRAQLQIQGGACFEGTYGKAGVRHNAGGSFRAKGTP